MSAIDVFGPEMTVILVVSVLGYSLLSLAPILWPAFLAYRRRSWFPRPILFAFTVAALVYGAVSIIAFVFLVPIEAYSIFVAPSFKAAGFSVGAPLLKVSRFITDYWWLIVPPIHLALTWLVTNHVGRRWQHVCGAPPNNSFKPKPLRGSA